MNLHERALEALVGQLDEQIAILTRDRDAFCEAHGREEARIAWLEKENDRLRAELASGAASPMYMAPSKEREERRAEEATSALFAPHVVAAPLEDSGAVVAKRLSEAEKRAFLLANGWTCHDEIESQNIRVCWENGAKWYSLEDAYALCTTEISKGKLRGSGWESVVDPVDEIERWKRPGAGELVMFHVACAEVEATLDNTRAWLNSDPMDTLAPFRSSLGAT